jgi:hypothetical protein
MTAEQLDYKGFLAQLRQRRTALRQELDVIEAVIVGMEQMSRIGASLPGLRNKEGTMEIQKNTFSAFKPSKAATRYLGMVRRREATTDIVQALRNGGVKSSSDNIYSIVYTALNRLAKKGVVRRIDGPHGAEWELTGEASE